MLGNFETLGSKFRHETVGLLPSFATISKNPFLALYKKKETGQKVSKIEESTIKF